MTEHGIGDLHIVFKLVSGSPYKSIRLNKKTLPKFTCETYIFSAFLEEITILCILEGKMPSKCIKLYFFSKELKKNRTRYQKHTYFSYLALLRT